MGLIQSIEIVGRVWFAIDVRYTEKIPSNINDIANLM